VNLKDVHGMTAIHHIAMKASEKRTKVFYEIYERLLQNIIYFGGDVTIRAKDGSTALDLAKSLNDYNTIKMF
jgi:ankyrin repeat protein